jgi:Fur family zinc uptake transcriptional regulator
MAVIERKSIAPPALLYNIKTGVLDLLYSINCNRQETAMAAHGFDPHDHKNCIDTALATVEKRCAVEGLKLTPVRRRVLEILLSEHRAMGAYDILPMLAEEGLGGQPPVVYRALDFLTKHRFVHKVERLNAYIACSHPGEHHSPAFMICRKCDTVVETESRPAAALAKEAKTFGFEVQTTVIELEGVCPSCQPDQ